MQHTPFVRILVVALLMLSIGQARSTTPACIDATSAATAQASWVRMLAQTPDSERLELQLAMLKLNMAGARNAYDAVSNPALQHPSITQIRDKVAGMNAAQIIALARRVTGIKLKVDRSP